LTQELIELVMFLVFHSGNYFGRKVWLSYFKYKTAAN